MYVIDRSFVYLFLFNALPQSEFCTKENKSLVCLYSSGQNGAGTLETGPTGLSWQGQVKYTTHNTQIDWILQEMIVTAHTFSCSVDRARCATTGGHIKNCFYFMHKGF